MPTCKDNHFLVNNHANIRPFCLKNVIETKRSLRKR